MTTGEGSPGERPWSEVLAAEEVRGQPAGPSVSDLVDRFSVDGEYDDYYEVVAQGLYEHGRAGIEVLVQELASRRIPQLRAALTVLAVQQGDDPQFVERAKSLAGNAEPIVAADAIRLLGSLGVTDVADRIRGLVGHSSPLIRASVLDYLARVEPDSARPVLIQALEDSDYIVRETAIEIGGNAAVSLTNRPSNE
ncbi:HEAT repeat domain-containing protein [Nocardia cyriacigeorgica]|uniref:HEAT repeat domain-containing protein n=1 Tax=Nocardia cyriacigeorgica TaxID=135487 RepID=UPI0018957BFA|nr:HEAT repeat domain-containing protein [Nocardia cyriacigeorgica]MBF6437188.1 HEAT repeat domain-containing protein [Nocardia cyriacigeorgica]